MKAKISLKIIKIKIIMKYSLNKNFIIKKWMIKKVKLMIGNQIKIFYIRIILTLMKKEKIIQLKLLKKC
jgi:hypothetical protein